MDMQDKEFDKIFNEKFEGFEVEPSAMVWNNIAAELDGKKAKVVRLPWLSIAATVLVALGAGIFFLQKGNSNTDQPKQNKLVANRVEPAKQITPVQPVETVSVKPADAVAAPVNHAHNIIASITDKPAPANNTSEPVGKTTEPVKNESPQLTAVVIDPESTHLNTATLPDVTLTPKMDSPPVAEKPVMAVQAVKKRGIHNLGGLINALVAKVDKREDKLIEFSDSDDDDTGSDLTGVNLGLIKIKKQQ